MEEYMKKEKSNKDNKNNITNEDTTKYGEFISSYFDWLTLDGQKKRANELDKMTKKKED